MSMSKQIPDHIKRVCRSLGYTLWLGGYDAWSGFIVIIMARLSEQERAALAFAALRSLPDETRAATCDAAFLVGWEVAA